MRKSIVVGIAVFSCLLLLTQYIAYQRHLIPKDDEQQYVLRELQAVRDRLTTAMAYSRSSVKTLAYIVSEYGIQAALGFDILADSIRRDEANRAIEKKGLFFAGPIYHSGMYWVMLNHPPHHRHIS